MPRGGIELCFAAITFFIAMYSPMRALDFAMLALVVLAAYRFSQARAGGAGAKGSGEGAGLNAERTAQKESNIARVLSAARRKGTITNHEVQALLGVSDATATRYLEELEQHGKLSQSGKTGSHVHYDLLT
jgi:CRP-like cAMP-binding protein